MALILNKYEYQINDLTELEKFTKTLTSLLTPNIFLLLEGELGVGKTTFTQLIAKNLGIKEKVTSPTFNVLQRYQIKDDYYLNHFDFFRLKTSDNLDIFQELTIDNLNIIEWPEKNPQFWQNKSKIYLKIVKQKDSEKRLISLEFPFSEKFKKPMNNLSIFDTHCHLADEKYREQSKKTGEIIQEAEKVGVKYILNMGQDTSTNRLLMKQLDEFPNLYGALGLHPNSNEDLKEENLNWIEEQLSDQKIIAIGEIGLDYYRTFTEINKQKYWFKRQLKLAKKYNLPVCLHIRGEEDEIEFINAFTDAYEIVKKVGIKKGVLHCFTGNWTTAKKFIDLGFYISFAGNITYKNAKWKEKWGEVLEKMPLERIVIETDAPYLSPEPLRGKINYPQNIIHTLKKIAEIKKKDIQEVAKIIFSNAFHLFKISYS